MRMPAALALWVLATASGGAQDKPAWKEYRSTEGNFSTLLPGKAEVKLEPLQVGTVKVQSRIVTASSDDLMILISVTPYPPGKHDAVKIAATSQAAFLKSVKAQAEKDGPSTLHETEGRACSFLSKEEDLRGEARTWFIGGRLYQVVAMGTLDSFKGEDAARAFDSFKLLVVPKK